ncbi:VOC family protein [Streptomyces sp. NPDC000410]|uniref:VOC family protein n=1 Tax=Streptomyces sp. NPDC000410 TaxID=3154254 RepID=UPI003323B440
MSLTAQDLRSAQDFYGAVLGWEFEPGVQGPGSYVVAHANGTPVAGLMESTQTMGVRLPVVWTAYFVADSADTIASRIRERGGTVAVGPLEFGRGRMAWVADPWDANFCIWEGPVDADWHAGPALGAAAWLELRTRDPFASAVFYGEVFDWDSRAPEMIDVRYEHDRVLLRTAGHTVAGIYGGAVEASPDPDVRPRWHVYFCHGDVDAAVSRAVAANGTVVTPPENTPLGRVAALRDPEGGLFHLTSGETADADS